LKNSLTLNSFWKITYSHPIPAVPVLSFSLSLASVMSVMNERGISDDKKISDVNDDDAVNTKLWNQFVNISCLDSHYSRDELIGTDEWFG